MEKNAIKKALYKGGDIATFVKIRKGVAYYQAAIIVNPEPDGGIEIVSFAVPVEDMGDAEFTNEMPAKLLIRYLVV